MTCMDDEVKQYIVSQTVVKSRISGIDFDMDYYADDPIIISTDKEVIWKNLRKLRIETGDEDKCANLD